MLARMLKFIDIGANLTDPMFKGIYNGSQKHQEDLKNVLERSWKNGVDKIIITSGCLEDIASSIQLANTDERLFRTVGCHPTRCGEIGHIGEKRYFEMLQRYIEADVNRNNNDVINNNKNNNSDHTSIGGGLSISSSNKELHAKVVAVGECGLDYERLQFCSKEIQLKYLPHHLSLSSTYQLPLFLHCRNAHTDLIAILRNHDNATGVVHSYDGSLEHAHELIQLGMSIGINGCSLRTPESLEVVKNLPLDKILVETDAPWCEMKNSHASFAHISTHLTSVKKEKWNEESLVKGRNEPANVRQVVEVIAAVRGEELSKVATQIHHNTTTLFKLPLSI